MKRYVVLPKRKEPKTPLERAIRTIKITCGMDLFKGLWLTLKEFCSKKVTIHYPAERIPLSPRYRAVHSLQRLLDSGNERCIGCGLCEKICTSNCIRIITHKGEDKRKKIDSYTINLGRCIYCGLCAEVCPELAIVMGSRFENASEARAQFASKNELLKPIDEARSYIQQEFSGFGSVSADADSRLKSTPILWDKPVVASVETGANAESGAKVDSGAGSKKNAEAGAGAETGAKIDSNAPQENKAQSAAQEASKQDEQKKEPQNPAQNTSSEQENLAQDNQATQTPATQKPQGDNNA